MLKGLSAAGGPRSASLLRSPYERSNQAIPRFPFLVSMKTFTGATAHIAVALLAFALIAEPSSLRAADPPIRVLLLSGQNNHD